MTIEIRKDMKYADDSIIHVCEINCVPIDTKEKPFTACNFKAEELTIGDFRQYFVKVYWNKSDENLRYIFDNDDPVTRPSVSTQIPEPTPTAVPTFTNTPTSIPISTPSPTETPSPTATMTPSPTQTPTGSSGDNTVIYPTATPTTLPTATPKIA